MSNGDITVKPITAEDKDAWLPLFRGYAVFYKADINSGIEDEVWRWLTDPAHVLEGYLAWNAEGSAVGLIHIRECPRPLSGKMMGFLDDMFVDPRQRGAGVADALFEFMRQTAEDRGWPVFRWLTQHYNYRGRAFYDKYTGSSSDFIMYQWKF
jgi:GNAT superfamily N-acetyltransferase